MYIYIYKCMIKHVCIWSCACASGSFSMLVSVTDCLCRYFNVKQLTIARTRHSNHCETEATYINGSRHDFGFASFYFILCFFSLDEYLNKNQPEFYRRQLSLVKIPSCIDSNISAKYQEFCPQFSLWKAGCRQI